MSRDYEYTNEDVNPMPESSAAIHPYYAQIPWDEDDATLPLSLYADMLADEGKAGNDADDEMNDEEYLDDYPDDDLEGVVSVNGVPYPIADILNEMDIGKAEMNSVMLFILRNGIPIQDIWKFLVTDPIRFYEAAMLYSHKEPDEEVLKVLQGAWEDEEERKRLGEKYPKLFISFVPMDDDAHKVYELEMARLTGGDVVQITNAAKALADLIARDKLPLRERVTVIRKISALKKLGAEYGIASYLVPVCLPKPTMRIERRMLVDGLFRGTRATEINHSDRRAAILALASAFVKGWLDEDEMAAVKRLILDNMHYDHVSVRIASIVAATSLCVEAALTTWEEAAIIKEIMARLEENSVAVRSVAILALTTLYLAGKLSQGEMRAVKARLMADLPPSNRSRYIVHGGYSNLIAAALALYRAGYDEWQDAEEHGISLASAEVETLKSAAFFGIRDKESPHIRAVSVIALLVLYVTEGLTDEEMAKVRRLIGDKRRESSAIVYKTANAARLIYKSSPIHRRTTSPSFKDLLFLDLFWDEHLKNAERGLDVCSDDLAKFFYVTYALLLDVRLYASCEDAERRIARLRSLLHNAAVQAQTYSAGLQLFALMTLLKFPRLRSGFALRPTILYRDEMMSGNNTEE